MIQKYQTIIMKPGVLIHVHREGKLKGNLMLFYPNCYDLPTFWSAACKAAI